jgi:hypothetical protein
MDKETFEFLRDWFAIFGLLCSVTLPLWHLIETIAEKFRSKDELIDEEQKWLIG